MSDTTTITPEERGEWRERLTSKFSCFDTELGGFTLRLLNALEQAEARADELETYISKLVCELTDGNMSKPYDISVITDEVEAIYRAYSEDEIAKATAKAEAENARLTKMVDWLAKVCAMHCRDKSTDDSQCCISNCGPVHCRHASADQWSEAASRAVAESEVGE